jgi:hypothetical protein
MAAEFNKDREFDIDVRIHIDPRLSQTKIASIKYSGKKNNGDPYDKTSNKEFFVSQSTSQNDLKRNISANLEDIFSDQIGYVKEFNGAFSRAYQAPITTKQKFANLFTGENNDKIHLKNRALAQLNISISKIYLGELGAEIERLNLVDSTNVDHTKVGAAKNAKDLANNVNTKAQEAIAELNDEEKTTENIIEKIKLSNDHLDAAKTARDQIEPSMVKKYSKLHLKLLLDLREYIQNEGNTGPFKLKGEKPFTVRNLDYKKDIELGANSSLYRLRVNLQNMTFWDDNFSENATYYPGWTSDKDKSSVSKPGMIYGSTDKTYFFRDDKTFLDNIINSTRYPSNNNRVSRSFSPLQPSTGGRATRRYKKMRGSRSRNYYNKSRKYY